ncbi:YeeE/YedE family protein [Phaeovulum vinaykumarii]|uniref:Uncharacterized protein n=1 Tax=Phaeovulum vinaykumarii TaxID=407234 RepID=A0A1N7JIY9_9RHOB|nr:YeeE/YedE family protein [Phaeovulum vinaykumarii]SIS49288.1 hypothetical protein SAMN05421795_10133 [Phaeovulum vinaykumarii]SOB89535.1 hypothetical protein SAMN05878426_10133 [Phaeovulum vinaykumarii]
MEDMAWGAVAALVGLVGGAVLGLAGRLGNFCTLGAIETALYAHDQRRLRMWALVLGVAILSTQALAAAGLIDLAATQYHAIRWQPMASILGGAMFGYGMALAGNCGFGALVRFGGGDLRSLVIVGVMGIVGFMALSGPLAPLRVQLFPQEAALVPHDMAHDLGAALGLAPGLVALALGAGLVLFALAHAPFRVAHGHVGWGVAAGLAVAWCLAGTSWAAQASFGAVGVEGPSYTAPVGRTLLYLMTSTGGGLSFSVGSVAGVLIGAFTGSMLRGLFRWEACDDASELGRQVGGAALMGVGGTIAMGCSLGQGLTGFATLAWSGPVTLAAIVAGAALGLAQLLGRFERG